MNKRVLFFMLMGLLFLQVANTDIALLTLSYNCNKDLPSCIWIWVICLNSIVCLFIGTYMAEKMFAWWCNENA